MTWAPLSQSRPNVVFLFRNIFSFYAQAVGLVHHNGPTCTLTQVVFVGEVYRERESFLSQEYFLAGKKNGEPLPR